MKKVLLLGNGASVHATAEAFHRGGARVFTYGQIKNPGIAGLSDEYRLGPWSDLPLLKKYVTDIQPDFVFIGPGDAIADGLADFFSSLNVPCTGPLQKLALLESSKAFSRSLIEKYKISGNPKYKIFRSDDGLEDFFHELGDDFVVKADGLAWGMGVKVSGDHFPDQKSGIAYARECLAKDDCVVVEEKLVGQEFSLMSFCDGRTTLEMPAVQDHKRAFDADLGPNTQGMGTYSDANHLLPFMKFSDFEEAREITRRVADALFRELGTYYCGILYGGFMLTSKGLRLLEYNVRTGDPEAVNVFPLLQTNFVDLCEAMIHQKLHEMKAEFAHKATVCKYIVPEGYPEHPRVGEKIEFSALPSDARMYYAAVEQKPDGIFTTTFRSLAFLGIADDLLQAEKIAEKACEDVRGCVFHRKDIGTQALIQKKVAMMERVRKA